LRRGNSGRSQWLREEIFGRGGYRRDGRKERRKKFNPRGQVFPGVTVQSEYKNKLSRGGGEMHRKRKKAVKRLPSIGQYISPLLKPEEEIQSLQIRSRPLTIKKGGTLRRVRAFTQSGALLSRRLGGREWPAFRCPRRKKSRSPAWLDETSKRSSSAKITRNEKAHPQTRSWHERTCALKKKLSSNDA